MNSLKTAFWYFFLQIFQIHWAGGKIAKETPRYLCYKPLMEILENATKKKIFNSYYKLRSKSCQFAFGTYCEKTVSSD